MHDIFISYRRSDSADVTGRISDRLREWFGAEHVFKDVDSIESGLDFREQLQRALAGCDVMLVVIGGQWLPAAHASGQRRLDDPDDFVRIEIREALHRKIPVIPVLLGDAAMPTQAQLPDDLSLLSFRQAARVRPDPDFNADMDRLCRRLTKVVSAGRLRRFGAWLLASRHSPRRVGAALVLGAVMAIGVYLMRPDPPNGPPQAPVELSAERFLSLDPFSNHIASKLQQLNPPKAAARVNERLEVLVDLDAVGYGFESKPLDATYKHVAVRISGLDPSPALEVDVFVISYEEDELMVVAEFNVDAGGQWTFVPPKPLKQGSRIIVLMNKRLSSFPPPTKLKVHLAPIP